MNEQNDRFVLRNARHLAADYMRRTIRERDAVVDATMGNGKDTLFLCNLVGETGHVYAFDVQEVAVESTRQRLMEMGLIDRCSLFVKGHQLVQTEVHEPIDAVMFNLGWLPGGDKTVTTLWETTRQAVEACLQLLRKGGVLTLCAYPGHAEGDRERENLIGWFASLRPQEYNVLHQRFLNAGPGAPECFVIQKQ